MERAVDMTIMIVDDTDDVRDLLRLQLTGLGYRVVEAANGQEAIARLNTESPDLILMDLSMPLLDGIEATRIIRRQIGNHDVIIVAFTALHCDDIKQQALAAGFNDYAHKSFELDHLSKILERHLL